jgi:hypothetical protein
MPHFYDTCAGPIEGLYLPPIAWEVLRRENIHTLDQLRANADRLEQFDGISVRMAQVIRLALAYVTPSEEQISNTKQYDSWGA